MTIQTKDINLISLIPFELLSLNIILSIATSHNYAHCTLHTAPVPAPAPVTAPAPVHFRVHNEHCTLQAIHVYYML